LDNGEAFRGKKNVVKLKRAYRSLKINVTLARPPFQTAEGRGRERKKKGGAQIRREAKNAVKDDFPQSGDAKKQERRQKAIRKKYLSSHTRFARRTWEDQEKKIRGKKQAAIRRRPRCENRNKTSVRKEKAEKKWGGRRSAWKKKHQGPSAADVDLQQGKVPATWVKKRT